ncbi:UDP-N-acetylglucosamine transferase subunit alg13 [Choanephora cucurbitarum]|uniref:UDP-N-acetylglucosamine transferase subunit ALG13 n=1 Tax=Choanephora cucurbitarum TaxID=101091 RepID=A0A1C7NPM6_9FUNG|nr:UDP-N-acetylglucosamine transferase subunit alg13 [Choanephora cucurbitarum]
MSLFVTVGSTGFDDLIQQTTSREFVLSAVKNGFKRIQFQYGASEPIFIHNLQAYDGPPLDIDGYKYKNSITEDMNKADVIISHAGSGTILQALRLNNKKIIVVINSSLMDNHQCELANAMATEGYVICNELSELMDTIKTIHQTDLKPFPKPNPQIFASIVNEQMGFPL